VSGVITLIVLVGAACADRSEASRASSSGSTPTADDGPYDRYDCEPCQTWHACWCGPDGQTYCCLPCAPDCQGGGRHTDDAPLGQFGDPSCTEDELAWGVSDFPCDCVQEDGTLDDCRQECRPEDDTGPC
jgi:hypothetical protein